MRRTIRPERTRSPTTWVSRPRLPLVFAAMQRQGHRGMLQALVPTISHVVVTRATNPRAAEACDAGGAVRAQSNPSTPVDGRNDAGGCAGARLATLARSWWPGRSFCWPTP